MNRDIKRAIKEVARRTGLSVRTVTELLKSGWTYTESIKASPTWTRDI